VQEFAGGAAQGALRSPEAVEPIRIDNRIRWRVRDSCIEVDAATWHDRRLRRVGYDWSARPSGHPVTAARSTALQRARDFLRASREEHALELADADDATLLSRLDVVTPDGGLTTAGPLPSSGERLPRSTTYAARPSAATASTACGRGVGA
jgi:ATP-dependent DNA helicase RecG